MLAPMIIGTAFASGSGFSGAATSPTTIDVVTDELWTRVVASNPTMSAINGLEVALKNASSKSPPRSLKPSPSPRTPTKKTKSKTTSTAADASGVVPGREFAEFAGLVLMPSRNPGYRIPAKRAIIPSPPTVPALTRLSHLTVGVLMARADGAGLGTVPGCPACESGALAQHPHSS